MSVTNAPGFDPLTHKPPKYDLFGRLKKVNFNSNPAQNNVLLDKEKYKIPWENERRIAEEKAEPMTQTKLFEQRRKEKIPNISYDLDGDGYVGGRDLVLAKHFDKDRDGKLNEVERKAAYDAIHNNVEDKFVWNLENQGANRGWRIMQKRGKFVDAEDWFALQDTYPAHPISSKVPQTRTKVQLKEKRKEETRRHVEEKMSVWEKANPKLYVNEPLPLASGKKNKYNSMDEKKRLDHRENRLKCGLAEVENDIKLTHKDPTLAYIHNPKHKTQRDLKEEFRKENQMQYERVAERKHHDDAQRLQAREDEIFTYLYSDQDRMTFNKLKEKRRKETLDYNSNTFSKQAIGVHGQELPKFAECEEYKEYWKLKEGYKENPGTNSLVKYKEKVKYWKKPEELLINEHQDEVPTPDAFKKEKVLKEKKDNLIIKVNNLNHFKDFDPDNPRPIDVEAAHKKHIYKWTTLVHQFAPHKFNKGRFFDSLPDDQGEFEKGIFSSFGEDGVFESNYMKRMYEKNKDDKLIKINDNEKAVSDMHDINAKESLYQKLSTREFTSKPSSNQDRPKSLTIRSQGF